MIISVRCTSELSILGRLSYLKKQKSPPLKNDHLNILPSGWCKNEACKKGCFAAFYQIDMIHKGSLICCEVFHL